MEPNLPGLLTDSERQAIQTKLALKRPITLADTRRLLEHIEILEMVAGSHAPAVHPV